MTQHSLIHHALSFLVQPEPPPVAVNPISNNLPFQHRGHIKHRNTTKLRIWLHEFSRCCDDSHGVTSRRIRSRFSESNTERTPRLEVHRRLNGSRVMRSTGLQKASAHYWRLLTCPWISRPYSISFPRLEASKTVGVAQLVRALVSYLESD